MPHHAKPAPNFKPTPERFAETKTGFIQLGLLALSIGIGVSGAISFILNPEISGWTLAGTFGVAGAFFIAFLALFVCGLFSKEIANKQTAKSLQKWAERELNVWVPLSNLLPMVEQNREAPTGRIRAVKNERPVVVEFTKNGTLVLLNSNGSQREPNYSAA